jgi:hypothetical protein
MLLVPERRRSRQLPTRDPRGASAASGVIKHRIARAAVLRRSEGTCFWCPNDDEVGSSQRAIRAERAQRAEQSDTCQRNRDIVLAASVLGPIDERNRQRKRIRRRRAEFCDERLECGGLRGVVPQAVGTH